MATGCENGGVRTVGVEEEFLLVAARHDHVAGVASEVLRVAATRGDAGGEVVGGQVRGALVPEFLEEQLEAYTSPTESSPISANPVLELRYLFAEGLKVPVAWVRSVL